MTDIHKMTATTEEAELHCHQIEEVRLLRLAAELDALRANYQTESQAFLRTHFEFHAMQRRIARQRRALAKLYGKRHDKNGRLSNFLAGMKAENARLREGLRLAIDAVEFWAAYASPYFQDKHDLAEDLQKLRAALGETQ